MIANGFGIGTTAHTFATWSDGGAASHITGAINAPVTFRATYGGRANVALAANGATATASSTYGGGFEPSGMIDGDREGQSWGSGGGLNDATPDEWPDWVEVAFAGTRTINEVDVFSVQDDYGAPTAPTAGMTFSLYGLTDFAVEYWDGTEWTAVPGGVVNGNSLVWRQITFAPLTTTKIRVWVTGALGGYSRITEVEAYQAASAPRANVALASGGATATGESIPFVVEIR